MPFIESIFISHLSVKLVLNQLIPLLIPRFSRRISHDKITTLISIIGILKLILFILIPPAGITGQDLHTFDWCQSESSFYIYIIIIYDLNPTINRLR